MTSLLWRMLTFLHPVRGNTEHLNNSLLFSAAHSVHGHVDLGTLTATRSWTACAAPSLPPLLSSARPSSASCVTNGPRTAGRTPWGLPTWTHGMVTRGRTARRLSTTRDSLHGGSTMRKCFLVWWLARFSPWCLEHTVSLLLAFRGFRKCSKAIIKKAGVNDIAMPCHAAQMRATPSSSRTCRTMRTIIASRPRGGNFDARHPRGSRASA